MDLWNWFRRLRSTRSETGAITETEMHFFFKNRGIRPQPWQIEALVGLDLLSRTDLSKLDEEDDH